MLKSVEDIWYTNFSEYGIIKDKQKENNLANEIVTNKGQDMEADMDQFYLRNIELVNFRRFTDSKFELNSKMSVFIGKNASGKTTVLDAVNVILGAYLASYKEYVPSRFVRNISDSDVRRKSMKSIKNVAMTSTVKQFPCTVSGTIQWDDNIE